MILKYKKQDGTQVEFELGDRAITIGRSPEADLVILDDKASRIHCGIRMWDGDFFIKNLKAKNGTFVNGQPIDMVKLNPGDRIRVGNCTFSFEAEHGKGSETILREITEELERGKGYSTILREVVEDTKSKEAPLPTAQAAEPARNPPALPPIPAAKKPAGVPAQKKIQITGTPGVRKLQVKIKKPNE